MGGARGLMDIFVLRCSSNKAMSRQSRDTGATWRHVWSGMRRDADARALVLASENGDWDYERLQVGGVR